MRRMEEEKKSVAKKVGDILDKIAKPKTRFARVREKMAEKAKENPPPKSGLDILKERGIIW